MKLRPTLFVLTAALVAAFACSSLEKTAKATLPGRSLASLTEDLGLKCITHASVLQGDDSDTTAVDEWLAEVSPSNARVRPLTHEEKSKVLGLALAEAYTYGQVLTADYDRLVKKKYSLRRIMKDSQTYARLQALYFIKHELLDLVRAEFRATFTDALRDSAGLGFGMASSGMDPKSFIRVFANEQIKNFVQASEIEIKKRASEPKYATLALAEIKEELADLLNAAVECDPKTLPTFHPYFLPLSQVTRSEAVLAAVTTLPKNPVAYRKFQPKKGELGVVIEKLVKQNGSAIKASWNEEANREPQSLAAGCPDGKVFCPTAGKGGNTFGKEFPLNTWALTFDDGPATNFTGAVLDDLKKHGMQATFFILTKQINKYDCPGVSTRLTKDRGSVIYPNLALREQAENHAIASHSYYHSQSSKNNDAERKCETEVAALKFKEVLGLRPKYFRLPYGEGVSSPVVRQSIADAGMIHIHWSVDTLDWQDKNPTSIYKRTLAQMATEKRGIILFHDIHSQSRVASEMVMRYLKDPKNKIRNVTIPEIINELNATAQGKPPAVAPGMPSEQN